MRPSPLSFPSQSEPVRLWPRRVKPKPGEAKTQSRSLCCLLSPQCNANLFSSSCPLHQAHRPHPHNGDVHCTPAAAQGGAAPAHIRHPAHPTCPDAPQETHRYSRRGPGYGCVPCLPSGHRGLFSGYRMAK